MKFLRNKALAITVLVFAAIGLFGLLFLILSAIRALLARNIAPGWSFVQRLYFFVAHPLTPIATALLDIAANERLVEEAIDPTPTNPDTIDYPEGNLPNDPADAKGPEVSNDEAPGGGGGGSATDNLR